jgi:CheY-like chemotaxis protein
MAEILIVEDYSQLASILSRMLRRQGHTCVTALTVAEALNQVDAHEQHHFDCAILDIDLPDGDGVTLAERLVSANSADAIFFFTATIDPSVLARAARLGGVFGKVAGVRLLLHAIECRFGAMQQPIAASRMPLGQGFTGQTTATGSARLERTRVPERSFA